MEGGVVDHVARVVAGEPLYVEPTPDFVPYIYPPLGYHLAALVARVTGVGFLAVRLVSIAASLGIFLGLARLVSRDTGSRSAGLVAAGLFAATWTLSGSFLDIGRVDAPALCLLVWGACAARCARTRAGAAVAGLLLAAAFLCKQSALVAAVPVVLGAVALDRRRGLVAGASLALAAGASTAWLAVTHAPWYGEFVFRLPGEHALVYRHLLHFWTRDVAAVLLAALVGVAALVPRLRRATREPDDRGPALFLLLTCGGLVASSWLTRLHSGNYANVLMPMHAAVCLGAGCALGRHRMRARSGARAARVHVAMLAALAVQFGTLVHDPRDQVPSAAQAEAHAAFVERLRSIEGRVVVPFHGHVARLAGKRPYSHNMGVADVLRADGSPMAADLRAAFERDLAEQAYDAVVLDVTGWNREALEASYIDAGPILEDADALVPVTGAAVRPWRLYLPRR